MMTHDDRFLLAFYGDDFTGSSAAMEVTAFAGLPTVLFLDTPTPERLARIAGHRVVGVAGVARSNGPTELVSLRLLAVNYAPVLLSTPR